MEGRCFVRARLATDVGWMEEKAEEPMLEKEPLLDLSCRLHRGRGGGAKIYATYAEGRNAMPS